MKKLWNYIDNHAWAQYTIALVYAFVFVALADALSAIIR